MRKPSNSILLKGTTHKQKIKAAKYIFLILIVTCLQWESTVADPESVKGLLADNIDHQANTNQALKTQKKQYPLTGRTANGKNEPRNKKEQKVQNFQAQKHQKLLNAIEENDLPRIISSSRGQKPSPSAIRDILANNEARARNKFASDLAARNINFLNERARPPPNIKQGGAARSRSGNNFPESLKGKEKDLSRFHPDSIGRISYRGKNGKASRPFGKFLQSYPTFRQRPWANSPRQLPPQFPKSQPFQGLGSENFMNPKGLPPIRYGMPNDAYKKIENNENQQKQFDSQNWNGRVNSINNASPPSNIEAKSHKWPTQPKAKTVSAVPLNNERSDKDVYSIIKSGTKINEKPDRMINNQVLENTVPQQMSPNYHKDPESKQLPQKTGSEAPSNEQNLNQVPENIKTENSNINMMNPISSPSPILTHFTTIKSAKTTQNNSPKMEMLKADKKAFDFPYDTSDIPRDSVSALVIGMTFVVIFIVMALGLVGHSIYSKLRDCGGRDKKDAYFARNSKGRFMRSPNEEDRTPPELRTGCGQASFVQPEHSMGNGYGTSRNGGPKSINMDQNGVNQPFFNGKLIFHEVNSNNTSMRDKYPGMNGINSHLPSMKGQSSNQYLGLGKPGEHLGAIPKKMPSPAANVQITDDLISPKYDDKDQPGDSTGSEEEDSSDDTVYECPGLAASSGDDIVVANPFFMPGQNFTPLVPTPNSPARKTQQPISKNEAIFHRGITGFN